MGQDQPEAQGGVFEVLAGGLRGAAYRRFGGRVQAGPKCDRASALSAASGVEHVVRDLTP